MGRAKARHTGAGWIVEFDEAVTPEQVEDFRAAMAPPRDPYLEDLARVRDRIAADRARYQAQRERHPKASRVLRAIASLLSAVGRMTRTK